MNKILQKLRASLFSNRLAFFLMTVLFLLILLSAIIPQKNIAEERMFDWQSLLGDNYKIIERTGLDNIYNTPFFFIVLGLFAINLTVVNIRRFKLVFAMEKTLLKARYLGSIIFHLSLLLIIAGIILNYLYKFDGVFGLTEEQSVTDSEAEYFRIFKGPYYRGEYNRFGLKLVKVYDDFKVGSSTTEAAEIVFSPVKNDTSITSTIMTNKPLKWSNLELHFGQMTGYSPEIILYDSSGNYLFKSFVRLATRKIKGEKVYSDYVIIQSEKLKIDLKVRLEDNIFYDIKVANETELLYDGVLTEGDTARFSGYAATIPRLRRWCYIDVVESPYLWIVFTGFWTAIAGLVIGFIPRFIDQMKESE